MNKYAIKLIMRKQLFIKPIYKLSLVQIEICKTYIETYLKIRYICFSKSSADAPIFFNKKLDKILKLYINYNRLNKLTIKNCYHLLLIEKFLKEFSHAKQFTPINLINAYYIIKIQQSDS